jgi:hypothetical protein
VYGEGGAHVGEAESSKPVQCTCAQSSMPASRNWGQSEAGSPECSMLQQHPPLQDAAELCDRLCRLAKVMSVMTLGCVYVVGGHQGM